MKVQEYQKLSREQRLEKAKSFQAKKPGFIPAIISILFTYEPMITQRINIKAEIGMARLYQQLWFWVKQRYMEKGYYPYHGIFMCFVNGRIVKAIPDRDVPVEQFMKERNNDGWLDITIDNREIGIG